MMNVVLPGGHVAEIQVNIKEMLLAKDKAHPLYERERTITGRALRDKRDLDLDEAKEVGDLQKKQRAIYDGAWLAIRGKK